MTHDGYFRLGKISKLFSFKGEVVAYLDSKHPEEYLEMESVFVEINNKLVPFFISNTIALKAPLIRLQFEGVTSEKQAKAYVGCDLYLPEEELSEADQDDQQIDRLLGFAVQDTNYGELGEVIGIDNNPHNPLIQVEHTSGEEVIIPFVDEIVQEINQEDNLIIVTCPDGLIDLYLD